jgi:hypothetical protein
MSIRKFSRRAGRTHERTEDADEDDKAEDNRTREKKQQAQ